MQSDHTTESAVKAILDEMEDKLLLAMQSDKGTEMCAFQWLPNSRVIHFFTSENGNIKCAMVECFQQNLQGKMHHHMMANRTQHFMHVLLALLHTYNATHHSTIDMVPRAVNRTKWVGECLYLPRCLWYMTGLRTPIPRDWVRMSKSWSQLTKGYTGHWRRSSTWRQCKTLAPWPTVCPMPWVKLSRKPSMSQSCRKSCCWTTLM